MITSLVTSQNWKKKKKKKQFLLPSYEVIIYFFLYYLWYFFDWRTSVNVIEVGSSSDIKVICKVRRLGGARTAIFGIIRHQMRNWE
jgi:hypothetical protein